MAGKLLDETGDFKAGVQELRRICTEEVPDHWSVIVLNARTGDEDRIVGWRTRDDFRELILVVK